MDKLTEAARSALMAKVHGKNTLPERTVRRLLHSLGYRYRLHYKQLPGKPDLVFPSRRKAIFVNGCFWHGHSCPRGKLPTTRINFWTAKIAGNTKRDRRNRAALVKAGWSVLAVWECELRNPLRAVSRMVRFLDG